MLIVLTGGCQLFTTIFQCNLMLCSMAESWARVAFLFQMEVRIFIHPQSVPAIQFPLKLVRACDRSTQHDIAHLLEHRSPSVIRRYVSSIFGFVGALPSELYGNKSSRALVLEYHFLRTMPMNHDQQFQRQTD